MKRLQAPQEPESNSGHDRMAGSACMMVAGPILASVAMLAVAGRRLGFILVGVFLAKRGAPFNIIDCSALSVNGKEPVLNC